MGSVTGLNAGDLNTLVAILERQEIAQKVGATTLSWAEVSTAWASVQPVKYLKAALYKALTIEGSVEIVVRRKDWLTAAHRVRIGDKVYTIVNIATDKLVGSTTLLLKHVDKLDK